jgi:hypothetical protein
VADVERVAFLRLHGESVDMKGLLEPARDVNHSCVNPSAVAPITRH